MAISKKEAKKRYEEAVKKGYQAKLTDNWLVILAKGKRIEEQVE